MVDEFKTALLEAIQLAPDAVTENELRKFLPRESADHGDPDAYFPQPAGKIGAE